MAAADGLDRRRIALDLLLVSAVPIALTLVHFFVPEGVREQYVLVPEAVEPVTLFTAAFLHAGTAHLTGNLVGFTIGALSAYLLCLHLAERRWFWLSTVVLVVGLPVVVNWSSMQVLGLFVDGRSAATLGFSGVAAGFAGFAFAALLAFIGRWTDWSTGYFAGMGIFLLLCWEVLVIYSDTIPPAETGLVVLGVGLSAIEIGRRTLDDGLPSSRDGWLRAGGVLAVSLGTLAILVALVAVLFPAEVVDDGQFVNVFAHAIGFGYGFLLSGWGYRYWRTTYP